MKRITNFYLVLAFLLPFILQAQPVVNLGPNASICGDSLVLDAGNAGATYLWNTGATTQTLTVYTSGTYWVDVTNAGTTRDSITLVIQPRPFITQHPSDTGSCIGPVTLNAAANFGIIRWMDNVGNVLGYGNSLNYNIIDTTAILYESSQFSLNPTVVGRTITGPGAGTGFLNTNYGMRFDATQPIVINSVRIRIDNGPFTAVIQLENSLNQIIATYPVSFPSAGYYDVPLNFSVPIGNNYTLYMRNLVGGQAFGFYQAGFNWSIYTYPFMALTGSTFAGLYPFFYEWRVSTLTSNCASIRDTVIVNALPTPLINLHNDTTICGSSLLLDATNPGPGFNYLWSTGETTSTIFADTTDTYVVTVSVGGNCAVQDSMDLTVNIRPAITQHPVDTSICKGLYTLTALNDAGTLRWLDTTGNILGYGNNLNYNVQDTVTIWYEANQYEINPTVVGRSFSGASPTTGVLNSSYGMRFNATQPIIINTVRIRIDNGPFTAVIQLENSSNQIIATYPVSFPSAGYYDVPLNFSVQIGNNYTLYMRNLVGGQAFGFFQSGFNWSIYTYPFMALTGSTLAGLYPFFYDWNVSTLGTVCSSPLDSVTITALPTPMVNLHNDTTICGSSLLLNATNPGSGFNYLWNTGETTSTILADTTDTYVVTVSVGGNCAVRDSMDLTVNLRPTITQHPSDTSICKGLYTLNALSNAGTIRWLDTTGNILGYGNTLNYNVQDTVSIWYEANQYEIYPSSVARSISGAGAGSGFANVNCGMRFNAPQPFILNTVKIRTDGAFVGLIQLENAAGQIINSYNVSYSAAGDYNVPLNFNIPVGTNYTLFMRNITTGQAFALFPFTNWALYTYPFLAITGTTTNNLYGYFYEWNVSILGNICSSVRDYVTITALPTPSINLHNDTTICGTSLLLDATNPGSGFNYLWNTGETTATILAGTTDTYVVTVSVGGNCAVRDSMDLTVNLRPTITQHPSDTSICKGLYTLNALSNAGTIRWLDTTGNILGYGNTLNYNVQDTVSIWYEANQYEVYPSSVARSISGAGAGSGFANVNCGMRFNAPQPFILNTVKIRTDGAFVGLIQLENAAGQIINSYNVSYSAAGDYNVPLNFNIPVGTNYTLFMRNITTGQAFALFPFTNWALYTYPFLAITGTTNNNLYGYFYEWNVSILGNICSSVRDYVTITALPTPVVSLRNDTTICGTSILLDATNVGSGFNYLWSTGETTATIIVDTTATYQVTVSVGGNCPIVDSMNLAVNTKPIITQHPSDTSICKGLYQISALANAGVIRWLDSLDNVLGYGNTLNYNVQDTLTIWYESSQYEENPTVVGRSFSGPTPTSGTANINCGMRFNAIEPIILNTVKIRTNGPFRGLIQLENSLGQIIDTVTVIYSAAGDYNVPLYFDIPIGMNYTLYMRNITMGEAAAFFPFTNWATYTYPFIALTGTTSTNLYGYFYEWNVSTLGRTCSSDTASVTLAALTTPVVNLRPDTALCGTSILLDATNAGSNFNYLWSTGETTATIIAGTTDTYKVTVSVGGDCPISDSMNLVVNVKPIITQHPVDSNICKGLYTLSASSNGGILRWLDSSSAVLGYGDTLTYDFQDTTTIWYESSQFEENPTVVGRTITGTGAGTGFEDGNYGIRFNVSQPIVLNSVKIRIDNGPFTAKIILQNSVGQAIDSQLVSYPTAGYYTVPLNFDIPIGTNYNLLMRNIVGGKAYAFYPVSNWSIYTYPFIALTGSTLNGLYPYFYEWGVSTLGSLCSSTRDSVTLNTLTTPVINLVADSIFCQDTVILDIAYPNATYQWNDNSTNSTLLVTQEGVYSVTSTIGICSVHDSIEVFLNPIPTISLFSPDTTTCPGFIPRISSGADIMSWYSEPSGGNYLGEGGTFMYNAQNTDTIWVQGQNFSNKIYTQGLQDTFVGTLSGYFFTTTIRGLSFNTHEHIKLKDVTMYITNAPFVGTIELWDANDVVVASANVTLFNEGENLVPLDFIIPKGQNYKLLLTDYNAAAILTDYPLNIFPITGDYLTIVSGFPAPTSYQYFYKWNVQALSCPSERMPSYITVLPAPNINFPVDTIICGDTLVLDATSLGAQTYLWSTGSTAASIIVDSNTTISLTASIGICSNTDSTNVFVVEPPDLIFPPADTVVCGGALTLYASGNAPYYAWYNSEFSTTPFGLGDSILFSVQDTTTIWVEGIGFIPKSSTYGAIYNPSVSNLAWISPQISFYPARGLGFNVHSPIILDKVSVYADDNTTATLTIYKSSFPYYSQPLTMGVGENVIVIDTLLEAGNYFIELSNNTNGKLLTLNPYINFNQLNRPEITFTGSAPLASQYNYFFNWKISTPSCATERLPVHIVVPPSPFITMAADTATCVLNDLVIDPIAVNLPAYTYLWSDGSTADTLLTTAQGYYAVTVTNDGKCSSTKDIFVQFLATPNTQNNSDIGICAPQTVGLGTNPSDGILVWYDTAGAVNYLTAPYTVYIADTTNFYTDVAPRAVTRIGKQSYPNPNESSAYLNFIIANTFDVQEYAVLDSVAIYVETAPTTVAIELIDSFNHVLYTRSHTIQNARQKSFVPLDFVIPPGVKYQLNFANINTPFLVDQTPVATPSSSADIATLTGTTFNNVNYYPFFDWHFSYAYPTCHAGKDTFAVTINLPVDLQDSIRVCDTAFIDIQHPSVLSYNWSDGQTTGFATFVNGGNYYVTMTDGAACTIIDTINIQQPMPIGFSGNAVCDSVLTTAYTTSDATFIWSTGETTSSIKIPTTGIYRVTVTTNEGCVLIDTAYISQIILSPTPSLPATIRFCQSGILDAGFGGQGMSYLWSTGAITQQITVSAPSFYAVTVTHPLGCSGSDFTFVYIDYPPQASFTVFESGLSVGVTNTSTGTNQAVNYLWNMGDGTTYQIPNPLHTYDTAGCYRITLIVNTACGSDTASTLVALGVHDTLCTIGVNQIPSATAMNLDFQIAPNPNDGQFRLSVNKTLYEDSKLVIIDLNGRMIHQEELRANSQTEWQIQTQNLPSGVYFARLINSQESKTQRFTVITP